MAGRKPNHFVDKNNNQIKGLARRKDGRWRVIGTGQTFVEPDEDVAIHKYLTQYAPRELRRTIEIPVARPAPDTPPEQFPVLARFVNNDPAGELVQVIDEAAAFRWFAQQIIKNSLRVAQMTGIEQIGYLKDLKPPVPSPTLKEVGQLYLEHAKLSYNWRSKSRSFWAEFTDALDVATLRELTQEQMVDYADMVRECAGASLVRQKFGAIKAIINFPTKRGKWPEDCKRALALCSVLVPPRKSAVDPHPISRDDFAKLLKHGDPTMSAALLLMLNCCMYGGEVAAVNWSDLDLTKGVLVASRPKTGIVRVAVLWRRTVEALGRLSRDGTAVFQTDVGTQADHLAIYRRFKACRSAADLPGVQLSHIRDGSYTAAAESLSSGVGMDMCRLLAGHSTGISDHYLKRNPQMVAPACAAIERAYFEN